MIKVLRIFILLTILPVVIQAQTKELSLDEAIRIAIKNNPQVRIAKYDVWKAESAVKEAFGYALPSLDISATFSHLIDKPKMPFPDFEALLTNAAYGILFDENVLPFDEKKFRPMETKLQSFAQTNNYEAKAQITQILFNSTVFRGIGSSQIYYDISRERLSGVVGKTILNVKKSYYGILLTKNIYEITQASYMNAQENLRNVKSLYDKGLVSEFDALQAEVQVENIKPTVLQMENALKSLKNTFKVVLGVEQSFEFEVVGELLYSEGGTSKLEQLPDESEYIERAQNNNYDVKTLTNKREFDDALIALEKSDYYPSLAAFGSYSLNGSSDDWKFQNYSSTMVGVSLQLNLFNGLRKDRRIEQAGITVKQTEEEIAQLKSYLASQVKEKIMEIKRVQSLLEAQERNIYLAQRAYEIATARYKEGTGTQLEIQNADIALRQARTNKMQSVYNYIVAKAELNDLVGHFDDDYHVYTEELLKK